MKKKIVALCLVVGLLAVSVIGGTLAYFTDTGKAINTFTVGKVDITLDEAATDLYGVAKEDGSRVQLNKYKLVPGHTYVKDPTVTVSKDSEPCYVYVQVRNEIASVLEELVIDGDVWTAVDGVTDEGVQLFRHEAIMKANEQATLFNEFKVLTSADEDALDVGYQGKIVLNAYAIQAADLENGETTADAAAVAYFNALNAKP